MQPIVLGPLTGPSGQQDVYRQAMQAFAAELGTDCPDTANLPALDRPRQPWWSTPQPCWPS
ncbi:MAG: hypothetical protein ACLQDY_15335 [Streptosporangiaceae bacterium]